ncbi:MAG: Gfo/Idh/MocA family oxidoreductase [Verrucomicrobia bacterium]|nr:Gfo/Idh/MocA family oxidoreductase [Verrucomicrobiota bacterium]
MHTRPITTRPMARRDFLKTTTTGAALLTAVPASLRGAPGANERLAIGCIGVGGRGTDLLNQILSLADARNVQVTAVCDVWQKNLAAAAARVTNQSGQTPRQYTRFHELLGRPDIDAVTIATPDFSHGPILLAALRAGKDVYIEKPMTIDVASANEALDLARAGARVVQVGTQRRSEGRFRGAAKLVASGVLGQLSRVSAAMYFHEPRWARDVSDCHAADVDWDAFLLHLLPRAFDARLLRQWQLYRDTSNGLPGLWMTHYADAVHLVTGARYPTSAVAHGGVYVWKDGRDTTDTFHALLEYPEGFLFDWGMGLGNSTGVHFTLHGTLGTLDLERWRLGPEGGRNTPLQPGPVPAEPDQSHMDNWLACLRTRERPNADIQFGHQHTVATVMAARALETGRRQRYDPAQRTLTPG